MRPPTPTHPHQLQWEKGPQESAHILPECTQDASWENPKQGLVISCLTSTVVFCFLKVLNHFLIIHDNR